jgi:hypothetical protein
MAAQKLVGGTTDGRARRKNGQRLMDDRWVGRRGWRMHDRQTDKHSRGSAPVTSATLPFHRSKPEVPLLGSATASAAGAGTGAASSFLSSATSNGVVSATGSDAGAAAAAGAAGAASAACQEKRASHGSEDALTSPSTSHHLHVIMAACAKPPHNSGTREVGDRAWNFLALLR